METLTFSLFVPTGKGVREERSNRQSNGVARDRLAINVLTNIKDNEAKTWKLALTRTFEDKSPSGKTLKVNRVVSSLLTNDVSLYQLPNKLNKLRTVVVLSK